MQLAQQKCKFAGHNARQKDDRWNTLLYQRKGGNPQVMWT